MPPASHDAANSGYRPGSPRQRAVSAALSTAIIAGLLALAIWQTGIVEEIRKRDALVSFDVVDRGKQKAAGAKRKEPKEAERQKQQTDQPAVAKIEPTPTKPEAAEKPAFSFIKLSRADMAASDIGKMKPSGGGAAAKGGGGNSSYGPGEGPGGVVLYNADWFRRPTNAELSGYLPKSSPGSGWGLVACQTVERNHVENCQILGESPRGSGFGRAVQNAAWQFLVIPPRVNGKPQIGEWVRIRIDYTENGAEISG